MTEKPAEKGTETSAVGKNTTALDDHQLDDAVGGAQAIATSDEDGSQAFATPETSTTSAIGKPIKKLFKGW